MRTDFVHDLKPLLDTVGNEANLTIILFTLDESTYSSGLAWWFYDSVEGMRRYKQAIFETAGFYNAAGFNDDIRAFLIYSSTSRYG